jgi:hypothetical protein
MGLPLECCLDWEANRLPLAVLDVRQIHVSMWTCTKTLRCSPCSAYLFVGLCSEDRLLDLEDLDPQRSVLLLACFWVRPFPPKVSRCQDHVPRLGGS